MRSLAIALALLAAPMPGLAQAHPNRAAATAPSIAERGHIRTTLHGSSGPLVVLIPGMSTPGAVWDGAVATLKPDHRLLVVEVKGFGGAMTPANAAPGMIDGIVADLSADLKARKLGSATIAGHSFGGLLAMKFALAHPAQAGRLMIVDALPFFGTVFDDKATVETTKPRAIQMRDMMINGTAAMRAAGAKGTKEGDGARGMSLSPDMRVKIANWSLRSEPTVVAEVLYEDLMTDLRQDIARITVPVTVLYQAEQDPAAAKKRYETDYSALRQARLVPVAKTSHFIMLDQPQSFTDALAELIAR